MFCRPCRGVYPGKLGGAREKLQEAETSENACFNGFWRCVLCFVDRVGGYTRENSGEQEKNYKKLKRPKTLVSTASVAVYAV